MSKKLTVCLVDDDAAVRNAFKLLMRSAGINLLSFGSAQEFLAGFEPKNVGCIILDVRMPGMSGLELQEILRQRKVYIPIIILTAHADVHLAVQAVKTGAFDVVEKPFNQELLLERVHKAFEVFHDWQKVETERREIAERLADLTPRELEVLDLMVGGRTNKMIAEFLGISRKTLDIHRSKVMAKMKARTVADLVRWRMLDQSGPGGATAVRPGDYRPCPMKYAIVIPDGCADEPQPELGGKTPLQAARKPSMDRVAQAGVVGRSNNVPAGLTPASDVATLSLFGYDPLRVYTGRAPLETVAMGLKLGPGDWAIRCNLVHVDMEEMRDFTAGHIASEDGALLMKTIQERLGGPVPGELGLRGTLEFHAGVSYRNILIYRGGDAPFAGGTKTQPPHDVPDKPIADHLPKGPGSDLLRLLMDRSRDVLARHPVNQARAKRGDKPATQIWLWGQGKAPQIETFERVYGKKGAILSAVDLVRGVGILLGWTRIDVPGATGYLDTDYAAKGRYGVEALKSHDLVCVHVEAPDEASHEGKAAAKVKAIEEIDRHIVGPLLGALPQFAAWRILVSPDHRTPLRTRAHAHGAVPFTVAGTGVHSKGQSSYDEIVAAAADLSFDKGHELMKWFLG
jgi:2,3-bisphosphoglycerate-independent phosphoglycerate mutase